MPAEAVQCHRNMTYTDIWPICSGVEDSWRHALVDCNIAKCVSSLLDDELVEHMIGCENLDVKLWLLHLKDAMQEQEFIQVRVTLWSIWWVRRPAIHEYEFESPLTTFRFIQSYLANLVSIPVVRDIELQAHQRKTERSNWSPPKENL